MTFERGDGGVGLTLQFQQRDLPGEVADEGVLRLVIISARGSQGVNGETLQPSCAHSGRVKDTGGKRPRR